MRVGPVGASFSAGWRKLGKQCGPGGRWVGVRDAMLRFCCIAEASRYHKIKSGSPFASVASQRRCVNALANLLIQQPERARSVASCSLSYAET